MPSTDYMAPETGFLGLSAQDAAHAGGQRTAVIIPFGLEATVSYGGGTAKGPAAILAASHHVELFDEEFWREPIRDFTLLTMREFQVKPNVMDAMHQISSIVSYELEQNRLPLILGGEHSLTAGAIRPFAERYDQLTVLHFDAHSDLREEHEGQAFSHASAMRRVMDYENIDLISVGIRSTSAEEIPYLEANRDRIKIYWAKDRHRWEVKEIIEPLKGRPLYISFDLDVFDSSLMPATGTPEPGGLFFDEALEILRCATEAGNLVGGDVVELAPIPGLHACDFLTARLVYKLLSYALSPPAV